MVKRMEERGPTLVEEDVEQLESQLGFKLPPEYRTFLLKYNGGRPYPHAFPIVGLANNPFGVIQVFFRINGNVESSNVDWNYEVMSGRLPADLLAIACDASGDLICLSLFGDHAGRVVFWDYYGEQAEPSYDNIYHIANSFPEFIESLQERPELPSKA